MFILGDSKYISISFITISILQSNKGFCLYVCLYVCVCVCVCLHHSGTAGPIWLNLFLLAPYWSGDGFRLKNFRIRDPVFPEIRKNPYFRVLFDQFGWNVWVILTLNQICFNTNKFLDRVSGSPNPESGFSGKIR